MKIYLTYLTQYLEYVAKQQFQQDVDNSQMKYNKTNYCFVNA